MKSSIDVVVVGGGNAALCAALAARESGAEVLVLERAPYAERGGNSTFTAGAMRFAYEGNDEILSLVDDLTEDQIARTDFGSYPEATFFDDIARVTENRADPDLVDVLVSNSYETLRWMHGKGVKFLPIYGRQAFEVDGRFTFWGGLTLEALGGGPGLVDALTAACEKEGIAIEYGARAQRLLTDESGAVTGAVVRQGGTVITIEAKAVVLGAGGFQANPEWRTRYLGPGWDVAKVRGTRFNTGDGIRMAMEVGAAPWGNWSGAHAVGWEFNAPTFGDLSVGDGFQKHSYPWGVMVNADGKRFVDEGADFRNYTYAKYGRVILAQPGQFAWQVFDQKTIKLLRNEYRIKQVTKVTGNTLEELARKMDGVNAEGFVAEMAEYNAAVDQSVPYNPNVKDGRRTHGLAYDKTNWANTIDEGPFEAYQVTCGITFTFGGIRISTEAEVIDDDGEVIPGLYSCGEMVGGIFYFNYPGGSGLSNGAVFGRIAGRAAAQVAAGRA
ncbi:FAD-dependent tricarballylate dehydrogenase TcuA [Nocardioides sp. GXZ039]|uniref:FAD-dependent tricarballylate dehydrogenase TcuA n=1 Tax=Nocardioides sp. GXZ039 TaxID=3136018 RepID=UPI0030F44617